jgi:hypothetical protein
MMYLAGTAGFLVLVVVVYFGLYNTLQGRRVLRYFGVRTNIRGNAHSGAAGGYGASNTDKRRG